MPQLPTRIKSALSKLASRLPATTVMAPDDGVIMLLSVLGPVILGRLSGEFEHVRMATFGAFQVALVNVSGLYRDRIRTKLLALMILLSSLVWLNLIHHQPVLEIASTFALMLAVGRAAAFSPTAVSLGMASSVAYLVIGAVYSDFGWNGELLHAAGDLALGGLWAISVQYLYGALRPGTPLALKVGDIYRTMASLLERHDLKNLRNLEFESVESVLVEARSLWSKGRDYRHGSPPRHLQLLSLIESADNIRAQLAVVVEDLAHFHDSPLIEEVRPKLTAAWQSLTAALRAVPGAISPKHRPVPLAALEQSIEELDLLRESLRQKSLGGQEASDNVENLPVLLSLRVVVEALRKIAGELTEVDSTARNLLPRPLWSRFWKTTPVSTWHFGTHQRKALGLRSVRRLKSVTSLDRHALRYASIVTVGAQLGELPVFDHGYWVPLHIALVLKPDYGSTANRSLERTSGTVWGSILGMALIAAGLPSKALWLILLCLLFAAITTRPASYAWFVGLITPAIVLMFELTSHQGWSVGLDRILSTVVGVAIALLGVALIFPKWERSNFPSLLEQTLLSYRKLYRRVTRSYLDPTLAPSAQAVGTLRYQTTSNTANLNAAIGRMLKEPRRLLYPKEPLHAIVAQMQRLASSIAALAYYQEQFQWRYHSEEFTTFCEQSLEILTDLARSAAESRAPQNQTDLEPILEKLRSKVRQVQLDRTVEYATQPSRETELAKAVREQTPVFTQLERIAAGLNALRQTLTRLFP